MNENTIIVPPEEQVENDRDARAEELESTFSYDTRATKSRCYAIGNKSEENR